MLNPTQQQKPPGFLHHHSSGVLSKTLIFLHERRLLTPPSFMCRFLAEQNHGYTSVKLSCFLLAPCFIASWMQLFWPLLTYRCCSATVGFWNLGSETASSVLWKHDTVWHYLTLPVGKVSQAALCWRSRARLEPGLWLVSFHKSN